jgi:hypothetical protein
MTDLSRFITYLKDSFKFRDATEFVECDKFDEIAFNKLKQDGLMITKTEPSTKKYCQYVKLGDYYLARKIYREVAWYDNGQYHWDLTNEPLYRRLVPPPPESVNHSLIISSLIQATKKDDSVYIEYGVRSGDSLVPVSEQVKTSYGVDISMSWRIPSNCKFYQMTTDLFSQQFLPEICFDYAFIDADHSCASVLRDFENIYRHIKLGGYIFLHDTCPCEEWLIAPRYCNDCYMAPLEIKKRYPNIELVTIPLNPGVTIIRKNM